MPKKKTPKPKAHKHTTDRTAHEETQRRKRQAKEDFSQAAARIVREATENK